MGGEEGLDRKFNGIMFFGSLLTGGLSNEANAAKGLGNPFKGKTFEEIGEMFKLKGFIQKGIDPLNGKGSYFNPKTGTKYFLDKGASYNKWSETAHVDVWYNDHPSLEKAKFFLDGTSKMYTPK